MFCKDCGFENAETVTYCKRCGAKQKPDSLKNNQSALTGKFLSTIGTVTMIGFAVALFALILLRYSLYFINMAGSFLISTQLLSIIVSLKNSFPLLLIPRITILSLLL